MLKTYQKAMKRGLVGALAAAMMLTASSAFAAVKPTTDTKPLSDKDFIVTIGKDKFDVLSNSFSSLAKITDTTPEAVNAGGLRVFTIANDNVAAVSAKRVNTLAAQMPVEALIGYSDKVTTARGISVGSTKLDMLAAYPQPDMNLTRYLDSLIRDIETGIDAADYDSAKDYVVAESNKLADNIATAKTNLLAGGLRQVMTEEDMFVYFFTAEDYLKPTVAKDFYSQYKAKGRFSAKDYNVMIVTQKNKVAYIGFISNSMLNETFLTLKEEAKEVRSVVRDVKDDKDRAYSEIDLLINLVSGNKQVDALAVATEKKETAKATDSKDAETTTEEVTETTTVTTTESAK